jgi:cobalt/nickel transport system ATP-binding protein
LEKETVIEINDLNYFYPNGHQALDHVSFTVKSGEKIALIGQNGAGKSTLLLHLNGIYSGEGTIKIDGLELNNVNVKRIRAKVGLVFQSPDDQLFSPTVVEDVAYGPIYMGLSTEEIQHRVTSALSEVNMNGYEDRVTYHLSVGEKKRIAIATVLAMKPEILVFDEPTAGLDPRARRNLIRLMENLSQTMLTATHDLSFAQRSFTRVILMNKGQIVADGKPDEIIENTALLEANGL